VILENLIFHAKQITLAIDGYAKLAKNVTKQRHMKEKHQDPLGLGP
jgi:hypothetical protein